MMMETVNNVFFVCCFYLVNAHIKPASLGIVSSSQTLSLSFSYLYDVADATSLQEFPVSIT